MRPLESFINQPIRSIQTMLRVIATDANRPITIIPDGIYGPQTIAAVSEFQKIYGLPITGIVDQSTWDRINLEYSPALVQIDAAQPLEIILQPGQIIRRGEYNPIIYLVQAMLLLLSKVYSSISEPGMSGIVDIPTSESISSFQVLSNLPDTGELDKITWKNLVLHYPLATNLHQSRISPEKYLL